MARRLRLHAPGAFYHVTLRGNHRQQIFFRDQDRDLLDGLVADSLKHLAARIHAYCWMPNHLHMLIQVSDKPLGRLMLRIASAYARTVQLRFATTGHLFERRYHAVLVDANNYLLTLVRYIHRNPVRAGLVIDPSVYPWSSHAVYLGQRPKSWVTTEFVFKLFAHRPDDAIRRYREFMGCAVPDKWGIGNLAPHREQPQILGDDAFVTRILNGAVRLRSSMTLDDLVRECCERFQVTLESLASRSRAQPLAAARAWLGHEALTRRIATVSAVARLLARGESDLRYLMRRHAPMVDAS
ncbi:MAG: REP-associated tyrosine transposase [Steroidobacteraceae bacterium]